MTAFPRLTLARDPYRAAQPALPVKHTPISERFHRISQLAVGGMGIVHFAEDMDNGHVPVALKTSLEPSGNDNIRKEIRALAALPQHPNLTRLLDHGYDLMSQTVWFAMPYIEGELLSDQMEKGLFPLSKSLQVIKQIASGLAAAAANGLLHKDLKPANVMSDKHGMVRVIDFGLTHLATKPGDTAGSPGYMSPEQLTGDMNSLDLRSDIFALGIIFHEMIDGKNPFYLKKGEEISNLTLMIRSIEFTKKGLPSLRYCSIDDEVRSLTQEFVNRMTAFDKKDRYQDYQEVIAAAEKIEARLADFNAGTQRELELLNPGPLTPLNID